MRCCIFCGKSPTSSEHIVPAWAGEILTRTQPPPSRPDRIVVGRHKRWSEGNNPDVQQEWLNKEGPSFTVKCVCDGCNNGWMSDIEGSAKPILTPMIEDQATTLSNADQESIAKWLGLKAICAQYSLPSPGADSVWATALAVDRRPPTGWQMRVGHYTGTHPVWMANTGIDFTVVHSLSPFTIHRPGFLFSVSLGHFVGQVVGVTQQTPIATNEMYFLQIWPHPLLRMDSPAMTHIASQAWPPERGLGDSDLKKCARDPAEPRG
jgi:hypothetical protein